MAHRANIVAALAQIVPDGVIGDDAGVSPYGSDGLTMYRQSPLAVVLPRTTEQVSRVLAWCDAHCVKVVARGSGTSLSGGALPLADGIVLGMARFNRILGIDYDNRCAVVQPGVTNLAVSQAMAQHGFYYAPDPSSQIACSIGGNVAENAGGVHCLKYGTTSPNLLGVELVLIDGTVLRLGGAGQEQAGYDLLGLVCGSEGLLGVVTEATVRILPRPATQRALLIGFPTVADASDCVAAIIAAGIIPAGR
ncbi:MAG: FAD-binding protein [Sandarakinorhabdus sp.]